MLSTVEDMYEFMQNTGALGWTVVCGVVAGAVLLLWRRRRRQKAAVNPFSINFEKDKVYLHMFPRSYTKCVPNLSPFAIKLETWFRLQNIKYEAIETQKFSRKGQIPYIYFNGEEYPDSNFIVEFLSEHFGLDKSEGLTPEQRGVTRAFTKMIEDSTSWTYFICRYAWIPEQFQKYFRLTGLPRLIGSRVERSIGKSVCTRARSHGIGRHSREEIGKIGQADLLALSRYLGSKPYFHGDEPTLMDCVMFGHLSQVVYVDIDFPHKKVLAKEGKNLVDHCERMKSRFWPDWSDLVDSSLFE